MCLPGSVLGVEGDVFKSFAVNEAIDVTFIEAAITLPEGCLQNNMIVAGEDGQLYHISVGIRIEEIDPAQAPDLVVGIQLDACKACQEMVVRADGAGVERLREHLLEHDKRAAAFTERHVLAQFEERA